MHTATSSYKFSKLSANSITKSAKSDDLPSYKFNYAKLFGHLLPTHIANSLTLFVKHVPQLLKNFFIEAFLIPSYRPEWATFSTWQPSLGFEKSSDPNQQQQMKNLLRKQRKKLQLQLVPALPKPVAHNHDLCQHVTINVAGRIYQPQLKTLLQFPNTLLGNPNRLAQFYDPIRNDYFIDRCRTCFPSIMYYYQSKGILRKPFNVSWDMFEDELLFYDLGLDVIEKLRRDEGFVMEIERPIPKQLCQRKLWLLFEYPESSLQAKIVAVISIIVIILSIFLFCLETVDSFQQSDNDQENLAMLLSTNLSLTDPFFFCETICMFWFVFEFCIRALAAPGKANFFKTISNLIDLFAILPYFISLFITRNTQNLNKSTSFTIFRVVRLVRVFRILKLSRHNRGLKVLGKTLKASIRELGLLMFFLGIGVILFSSGVYLAELQNPHETQFKSIIDAFWWSVITMTTCGYGDDVPITVAGRIVGALCAISGVLTLALPVPVIVSNFNNFYTREDDSVIAHIDSDHVLQCPYRAGWYAVDGARVNDIIPGYGVRDSNILSTWVQGENMPDDSDSDFETLVQVEYDSNKEIRDQVKVLSRYGTAAAKGYEDGYFTTDLPTASKYPKTKASLFIPRMGSMSDDIN